MQAYSLYLYLIKSSHSEERSVFTLSLRATLYGLVCTPCFKVFISCELLYIGPGECCPDLGLNLWLTLSTDLVFVTDVFFKKIQLFTFASSVHMMFKICLSLFVVIHWGYEVPISQIPRSLCWWGGTDIASIFVLFGFPISFSFIRKHISGCKSPPSHLDDLFSHGNLHTRDCDTICHTSDKHGNCSFSR